MTTGPFEFFKALPDQVTTERLSEARLLVAGICEVDVSAIDDSTILAQRLQGVSRAVSDIVLAKGSVETTDLRQFDKFNPVIMPEVAAGNVLRHFDEPETRTGRMFVAQPSKGYGAGMGVHMLGSGSSQLIMNEIYLPTDQQIDSLLSEEPCFWTEMGPYSQDFRSGRPDAAYPFHNRFYSEDVPQKYFGMLQELSTELLAITE